MTFDPGRILLVSFPFTDHAGGKLRPALVVSAAAYNTREDFVAVPISSRLGVEGFPILTTAPYFAATQLRGDSTVKWSKLMTLSGTIVQKQLGCIPESVLQEIQKKIRDVFS